MVPVPLRDRPLDLVGFGIVSIDDLLFVDRYPAADSKTFVSGASRQGGGLTGTALVAAARLGAKCAYAGVFGSNEQSLWSIEEFEREHVDCSNIIHLESAKPFHSIIVVSGDDGSRTIICNDEHVAARPAESVDLELVSMARVLFIDHLGVDGMLLAAQIARRTNTETVADIEQNKHPKVEELIATIDHLILSSQFAREITGAGDAAKATEGLHRGSGRACTAVTDGENGCWYTTAVGQMGLQHEPGLHVEVVDTTGCGDVFHGAYAAGIAFGWDPARCIRFANATAALKAKQPGGRLGIPNRAAVESLL